MKKLFILLGLVSTVALSAQVQIFSNDTVRNSKAIGYLIDNDGVFNDSVTALRSSIGSNSVDAVARDMLQDSAVFLGYNAQTGTTYTLVLADKNKLIKCTNASAITVTVPPNSSVAFPYSATNLTTITIQQGGAGGVTIAEGSGVTVNSYLDDLVLAGQYAVVTLVKTGINTWELMGNL